MGQDMRANPTAIGAEDPAVGTAMNAIRRIVRVLREASRDAEKTIGVSGAQLYVMHRLAAAGPLTINELAGATATHQSSVSVVVGRLVERGLVTRGVSAGDRRRREVALTPAGRRMVTRAPSAGSDRLVAGLAAMPGRARADLAAKLDALVRAMGADQEPADMFFEDRLPAAGTSRRRAISPPPARRSAGPRPPRPA